MSEKVKLPKEVCDALDIAKSMFPLSNSMIIKLTYLKEWEMDDDIVLNKQNADVIMRALVLGYEPELSAEEHLKNLYMEYKTETLYCNGFQNGILKTLEILGIHYDWMEDAE